MGSFEPPEFERGPSGIGASRARAQRRTQTATRMRSPHPRLGGAQHGARWKIGGEGESAVVDTLAARCGDQIIALHDRSILGERTGIDHLIVARSGIWVVDTELCRGKVELAQTPFGGTTVQVSGRNRSDLIAGLTSQVDLVTAAMRAIEPAAQVRAALCLVTPKGLITDSGLPALRPLAVREIPLLNPQRLAQHLIADGLLSPINRTRIARALAQRFPARTTR